MTADEPAADQQAALRADPFGPLRTRGYLMLLLLTALFGVVLSAGAYGFLQAVAHLQKALFSSLPHALGFHGVPVWWPLPLLAVGGLLTALIVRYLPGNGGHQPAEGLKTGGSRPLPSCRASFSRRSRHSPSARWSGRRLR